MTPEGAVKDKIRKWLRAVPAIWQYSPVQTGYGVAGVPDIVGCWEGRFFGIEVKAPGKLDHLRPSQELQIALIRQANGKVFITDNFPTWLLEFESWRGS